MRLRSSAWTSRNETRPLADSQAPSASRYAIGACQTVLSSAASPSQIVPSASNLHEPLSWYVWLCAVSTFTPSKVYRPGTSARAPPASRPFRRAEPPLLLLPLRSPAPPAVGAAGAASGGAAGDVWRLLAAAAVGSATGRNAWAARAPRCVPTESGDALPSPAGLVPDPSPPQQPAASPLRLTAARMAGWDAGGVGRVWLSARRGVRLGTSSLLVPMPRCESPSDGPSNGDPSNGGPSDGDSREGSAARLAARARACAARPRPEGAAWPLGGGGVGEGEDVSVGGAVEGARALAGRAASVGAGGDALAWVAAVLQASTRELLSCARATAPLMSAASLGEMLLLCGGAHAGGVGWGAGGRPGIHHNRSRGKEGREEPEGVHTCNVLTNAICSRI